MLDTLGEPASPGAPAMDATPLTDQEISYLQVVIDRYRNLPEKDPLGPACRAALIALRQEMQQRRAMRVHADAVMALLAKRGLSVVS